MEKLARIEGLSFGLHHGDSLDRLIDRELQLPTPEPVESVSATKIREAARRQAILDVIECFKADRANGCFKTLADVVLRLPEQAPESPPVSLGELHRERLDAFLESIRKQDKEEI